MTVSELISKLQVMNPNTKVVVYHAGSEDDGGLENVEYLSVGEYHDNTYCKADTCLEIADDSEMICKIICDYIIVR